MTQKIVLKQSMLGFCNIIHKDNVNDNLLVLYSQQLTNIQLLHLNNS